ncbi:hypothetical protein HOLleu_02701 [Holothuria leucospilota]|uniref:Ig-like domain-containing protein n=1 Tax=Holothuria leucospilota TaxID=206669 RepID=A0A9Q1HH84_HOLLE|nr:hypothetical protein HOLleu_02701 [Holothuria leucospilota]
MDCQGIIVLLLIFIQSDSSFCSDEHSEAKCISPQYLEIRTTSTIQCLFHQDFFAVLWYNSTDSLKDGPILEYQNMTKSGPGFTLGEFDIHQNGSLIINNVSLSHERTFMVGYLRFKFNEPTFINVEVLVTVRPPVPFPVLDVCGNTTSKCFSEVRNQSIQCSVRKARPEVSLYLSSRTVAGDINVSSDKIITPEGEGYTSRVTTNDVFHYSSLLQLLVCKASCPQGILENNESMVLAQKVDVDLSRWKAIHKYIERNTSMELSCTENRTGFLLWKKILSANEHHLLVYAVHLGKSLTEKFVNDIALRYDGSLTTSLAEVRHEGRYLCIYGDGLTDNVTLYDVNIIVTAYPIIDGCAQEMCCVLKAELNGNLTCKVTGIRPMVELEWKVFDDSYEGYITFTNHRLTFIDNGETFDVTLTAAYSTVSDSLTERVLVECYVSSKSLANLSTQVDLTFVADVSRPHTTHRSFTHSYPPNVNCVSPTTVIKLSVALCLSIVTNVILIVGLLHASREMIIRWCRNEGSRQVSQTESRSNIASTSGKNSNEDCAEEAHAMIAFNVPSTTGKNLNESGEEEELHETTAFNVPSTSDV